MLGDRLHDRAVDDDQVFRCRLHGTALLGVTRVEEKRGPLQADPVTLPTPLPGQLDLMLLAQQPLLHAEESEKASPLSRHVPSCIPSRFAARTLST